MASIQRFERSRKRGIVWVCDIASSSKYLNGRDSAGPTEEFLQRFLYTSLIAVEASGGEFIKWTGDGFLAWFETPLDRDKGKIVTRVFDAAWQLSFYVNVTQLAVESPVKFRIRHAITYEKDALVIDLAHSGGMASRDVLGRSVVLAFRISSLKGAFPSVATQKELVEAAKSVTRSTTRFNKLTLTREDKLKYFKGEEWGTKDLYVSSEKIRARMASKKAVIRNAVNALKKYEDADTSVDDTVVFKIVKDMIAGPPWAREVLQKCEAYIRDTLVPALKGAIDVIAKESRANEAVLSK